MTPTNVDDIYPLSPMQQGLLFHTLYTPQSGSYIIQVSCNLHGSLQLPAFEQAWRHALAQHPILRSSFHWHDLKQPLQVVYHQLALAVSQQDWRDLMPEQQQAQFQALVCTDRTIGFDPAQPPLMRITLLRYADDTYRFLWSFHHLLLDGWSMGLVLQHVFASYRAFLNNQAPPIYGGPPYAAYITWLQQHDVEEAEQYWRQLLGDVTHPTLLLDNRASATGHDPLYHHHGLRLSRDATATLQDFSRQSQITLNTLVQGAWALLLSRYSGESDVLFGITVAGRPAALPGVEQLVGLCINTLPVRVHIPWNQMLRQWLNDLQMRHVELRQYENSPLVDIHGWSGVPRTQPLFESILVFENHPLDRSTIALDGQLTLQDITVEEQTNYPLTIIAVPDAEFSLHIIYDSHYVDDLLAARLLEQMKLALATMVAYSERLVSTVSLLTPAELDQVLWQWNDTHTVWPRDACIHQIFESHADQTSDAIAVVCGDQHLTYGVLNYRANQLAYHLHQHDVGPEAIVGLCVDRSLALVEGLLGILKAGGAYLPLDPSYPWERLSFMLDETQATVLLAQAHTIENFAGHSTRIICLDSDWSHITAKRGTNPNSAVTADNLAYCIYTSGSSGRPKGVLVTHRGLCNVTQATIQTFAIRNNSRVFQFASISFDASVWQIFMALHSGASLDLFQRGATFPIPALVQRLQEQMITVADLPPSVLDLLPAEELPILQTVSTGGERCSKARAIRWSAGRRFFNVYGPTETTVAVTWHLVADVPEDATNIPIGRPIANTQMYLLDRHLQPVPVGVKGELYIGTVGLARGYHNHPALTAERFVPNPFGTGDWGLGIGDRETGRHGDTGTGRHGDTETGGTETGDETPTQSSVLSPQSSLRLYRTGDHARYQADGAIEFLGRADYQVKVRGFRIELEEIEFVLSQHPALSAAAVIARETTPGNGELIAYLVARHEPVPSSSEIRSFLLARLPSYMVPGIIVFLDVLPLLPNRKVDRNALPAPEASRSTPDVAFVTPRTEMECAIAAVWRSVLQIEQISIYDNFFDLGGHSLRMIHVHSQLQQHLKRDVSMVELFQYPTISALAKHLSNNQPHALVEQRIHEHTQKQKTALGQYRQRKKGRRTPDD